MHFHFDNVNDALRELTNNVLGFLLQTQSFRRFDENGDRVQDKDMPNGIYDCSVNCTDTIWMVDPTGPSIHTKTTTTKSEEALHKIGPVPWVRVMDQVTDGAHLPLAIESTRNGAAVTFQEPVIITYANPWKRVLFNSGRDANPFFHLVEAIWMLAGKNDVGTLVQIVDRMREYSDDGITFNGAYGHRWRNHSGLDQIESAISQLQRQPFGRRVYIDHWKTPQDNVLASSSHAKDIPCNLGICFRVNPETMALDMTVFNRSNDLIWGALGANYVHFGILQQYIANALCYPVGTYNQISNNLHIYLQTLKPYEFLKDSKTNHGDHPGIQDNSLRQQSFDRLFPVGFREDFDRGCQELMRLMNAGDLSGQIHTRYSLGSFVSETVARAVNAHRAYKRKDFDRAYEYIQGMPHESWKHACREWLERRDKKYNADK